MSEDFYNGDNGPKINFEDPVPPKKKKSGVIFLILLAVFFSP